MSQTNIYFEKDASLEPLKNKTVAVVGYGSQGRAHARNLNDSGVKVVVGARENGKSWNLAKEDGLQVTSPAEAAKQGDVICLLTPDLVQAQVYKEDIEPNLEAGNAVLFAHGFNVHFDQIKPQANVDVILAAPKGPGDLVRRQYEEGFGVPCLIAIHQDATGEAKNKALAYAHAIGGTKGGVIETDFAEETETDLFGEQAVLCGGATELVAKGFETLVEAGYRPEVAYFECLHELKLIVDLLYEGGFAKMHHFISETAQYGGLVSGPRVIDASTKERMQEVLKDIQDGTFANNWIAENANGGQNFRTLEKDNLSHVIEGVGKDLRARMSWINEKPAAA